MLARSIPRSAISLTQTTLKCTPRLLQSSSIQLKRLYTQGHDHTCRITRPPEMDPLHIVHPAATHSLRAGTPPIAQKPLLITFDAYETIYTPIKSIPQQYNAISSKYGIDLNLDEVKDRFYKAYQLANGHFPNYGKEKGLSVYQFWEILLNEMYSEWSPIASSIVTGHSTGGGPAFAYDKATLSHNEFNKMSDEIIAHFETKQAYKVYDDLVPLLQKAKLNNVKLCVASNADSQVTNLIINEFENLKNYFNQNDIYLSYDLEVCKPDPKFFEMILTKEYLKYFNHKKVWEPTTTKQNFADYKANIDDVKKLAYRTWHIGDEYEKDTKCVLNLGMGSILLDRDGTSGFLRKGEKVRKVHEKFYVVDSLDKVAALFGFP